MHSWSQGIVVCRGEILNNVQQEERVRTSMVISDIVPPLILETDMIQLWTFT